MPLIASSVQGLSPDASDPIDAARERATDGAHPHTAAVCRHLLGDALDTGIGTSLADLQAAES